MATVKNLQYCGNLGMNGSNKMHLLSVIYDKKPDISTKPQITKKTLWIFDI